MLPVEILLILDIFKQPLNRLLQLLVLTDQALHRSILILNKMTKITVEKEMGKKIEREG
jgi:hypothetical protein